MRTPALYVFRALCAMVAMPLVFIVVYPFVYMVLPETMARLADLPRDLAIFLLIEAVLVPLFGIRIYLRARHAVSEKGIGETGDTRDVL